MDIAVVAPDLQSAIARAPHVDVSSSLMRRIARVGSRHLVPKARTAGVEVRNVRTPTMRVRVYRPAAATGAGLLWIHGGGMVIGAPRQDDRLCAETAAELGVTIVSADYRMAPEHPYPVPQDDCLAAWDWLQEHAATLGVAPDRVALGGASAGAGLAASVADRLHARGGIEPVARWLFYPMLDDRTAADTSLDPLEHFVWTNADNRAGWGALLTGTSVPGGDDVPADAAPARRSPAAAPPTWIGVGDIDLFAAEDRAYAAALERAGGDVTLTIVPGAPHGFDTLVPDAGTTRDFLAIARGWLAERLGSRG